MIFPVPAEPKSYETAWQKYNVLSSHSTAVVLNTEPFFVQENHYKVSVVHDV